jgi:hypothetical protein
MVSGTAGGESVAGGATAIASTPFAFKTRKKEFPDVLSRDTDAIEKPPGASPGTKRNVAARFSTSQPGSTEVLGLLAKTACDDRSRAS